MENDDVKTVFRGGMFHNPWPRDWQPASFFDYLKFSITRKIPALPSEAELDKHLPVLHVDVKALRASAPRYNERRIQATFLGHASFYVQMEGVQFLTDPVVSDRASPVTFFGPKRYRAVPLALEDLPGVDFVLISHNHYDHLDAHVVHTFQNRVLWVVPKGLAVWFQRRGVTNVVELEWWQKHRFQKYVGDELVGAVDIILTPTEHWSKRHLLWKNESLWGSFAVVGQSQRLFFCGDSAYCSVFKRIGDLYGPFDQSLLPIGSYEPRERQRHSHMDPDDAVKVHLDIRSKFSIGMHFGTFLLTDEPVTEPPLRLQEACVKYGVPLTQFIAPKHGQTLSN